MAEANKNVETIECHYDMTRRVSMLSEDVKDAGTFHYCKSAGGFSLTSANKDGERVSMTREYFQSTSGGKSVKISASRNPAMRQMLDMVNGCLTGDFSELEAVGNVEYAEAGKTFSVVFVPKDKRAARHVKSISMVFTTSDYSLQQMTMTMANGDSTDYRFGSKDYSAECGM